jgi:succinate dehydrogenase / fumarate reductase cytochrome b subunit
MKTVSQSALKSSIFRKQIVAVTGLMLVGFIIMHMMGNFLIFLGPDWFNAYAEKLQEMAEFLWIARIGLMVAFLVHILTTILLTLENWKANPNRYQVSSTKTDESLVFAKRTMIYTGLLVVLFVGFHLTDFTLHEKTVPHTEIRFQIPGQENAWIAKDYGLYGLVWNSFLNPVRATLYILMMVVLGLHLSHAIQSFFQSLGLYREPLSLKIRTFSVIAGILVALGFMSIPAMISFLRIPPF